MNNALHVRDAEKAPDTCKATCEEQPSTSDSSAAALVTVHSVPPVEAASAATTGASVTVASGAASRPSEVRFATLADVANIVSETSWFWPEWLPRGHVGLLVAESGAGKSFLALDLVARMLAGGKWPDDEPCERVDKVMWVDTEGTQAVLIERANVLGVPLEKIVLPTVNPIEDLRLDNTEHWKRFESAVKIHRPPLIVVDTLRGAYGGDENASQATSALMKKLQMTARDANAAILVIHHLGKQSELASPTVNLDRVRGSSAIVANARVVWVIEDSGAATEGAKRLRVLKSNLARVPEPLGFVVGEEGVTWMDPPVDPQAQSAIEAAARFLTTILREGPRPATEVSRQAAESGISTAALRRAKQRLRVESRKAPGSGGVWSWSLPGNAAAPES